MTSTRHCQECGSVYTARKSHARFCSTVCRKLHNNRRATRGAELYDYYMAMRFERATHGGSIAIMNQMASNWRETDKRERDGRFSWAMPNLDNDPKAG